MSENRKLKVFLCHSKDDKPKVRELYHRLVADGFDAWLDEEKLMPGQDWDLEIRKAVRESNVVVVCLSRSSITKAGYVQKEIRFALDAADEQPEGAIYIIPAKLEDCQTPSRLEKWQWVNLFDESGYSRIEQALYTRMETLGIFLSLPFEPQMVQTPAGKFIMGSTEEQALDAIKIGSIRDFVVGEQPQHMVDLSEYSISKYPITNLEYQSFVRDAKYSPPRGWWDGDQFNADKDMHPVVNVSWIDAVMYCKWLSEKTSKQYRLPTEAEWEKAARGEDGRIFPWGNDFDLNKANTSGCGLEDTSDVGKYSPQGDSPYGCSDMAGNVWEWCNDWYNRAEYKQRQGVILKDPKGPQSGKSRVIRGGSFAYNLGGARCAYRLEYRPDVTDNNLGFRVVLSPTKIARYY